MQRAELAGVKMIAVGTQVSTSRAAIQFAEAYKGSVWAAVGFHPAHLSFNWHHDLNEQTESHPERFDINALRELAEHPEVVAIGECGLDYFRLGPDDDETRNRQKDAFVAQIDLAYELKKPLMIHCRAAFPDLIAMLRANSAKLRPGVIHFFTGTTEDAKQLLELGFSFTFGGVITFARDYDAAIQTIPIDRLLSETDAPYVSPAPYRGKRNEPAYVVETVKKLAELKGIWPEKMAEHIFENAKRIFGI